MYVCSSGLVCQLFDMINTHPTLLQKYLTLLALSLSLLVKGHFPVWELLGHLATLAEGGHGRAGEVGGGRGGLVVVGRGGAGR